MFGAYSTSGGEIKEKAKISILKYTNNDVTNKLIATWVSFSFHETN